VSHILVSERRFQLRLTWRANGMAIYGGCHSKHTDLGRFETAAAYVWSAGGIELTKVRRLIRPADGPWSL
jgi:hypothetical protein